MLRKNHYWHLHKKLTVLRYQLRRAVDCALQLYLFLNDKNIGAVVRHKSFLKCILAIKETLIKSIKKNGIVLIKHTFGAC